MRNLEAQTSPEACAPLRLTHARNVMLRACKLQGAAGVVVQLQGNTTRGIVLTGNDWARGEKALTADADVPRDAWRLAD